MSFHELPAEATQQSFGFSRAQLCDLVAKRDDQGSTGLPAYGGVHGIAEALRVSLDDGLVDDEGSIASRQATFGYNVMPHKKVKTLWDHLRLAFQDLTIRVVLLRLLSLILGAAFGDEPTIDWLEGFAILVTVALIVGISAINNLRKDKQFRALNDLKEDVSVPVLRNGFITRISKFKLLVGDIVLIEAGDIVPADAIVICSSELSLDESLLTGESCLVPKDTVTDPFCLSGTKVMSGTGRALVIAVGQYSQEGRIQSLLLASDTPMTLDRLSNDFEDGDTSEEELMERGSVLLESFHSAPGKEDNTGKKEVSDGLKTQRFPLQRKLDRLMLAMARIGIVLSFLTVAGLITRYFLDVYVLEDEEQEIKASDVLTEILDACIMGITILVVAIPEGLPLAVTIAFTYAVRRMLRDKNLVRHLSACEIMGSATTICSDKTGTLTMNQMTVMKVLVGGRLVSTGLQDLVAPVVVDELKTAIAVNSTASITTSANQKTERIGSPTECAALAFIDALPGQNYEVIRKDRLALKLFPFNHVRKLMSTATKAVDSSGYVLYAKGAAEVLIEGCSDMYLMDGARQKVGPEAKATLLKDVMMLASDGYRVLAVTRKALPDLNIEEDEALGGSTLICVLAIEDPVRPEVPSAIKMCQEAGIVVRMVTGDNVNTARSIALQCGILNELNDGTRQGSVMEGPEFRARVLSSNGKIIQSELDKIWPTLRVLARSSPEDKYVLVSGIMASTYVSLGPQIVAVTGDGTNDAPALKRASVGFAMGVSGTAVAKDASDIIIMDDNFASIVNAVKWGRNTYECVCKFLQFQLSVIITAVSVAVICALVIQDPVLTAVQLLWVNLVMDASASLAITTEQPSGDVLRHGPQGINRPLLSSIMTKHIIGQSAYQMTVLFVVIFCGPDLFGLGSSDNGLKKENRGQPTVHFTIVFNIFVQMTLWNQFNCRILRDDWNVWKKLDWPFVAIFICQQVAQAVVVQFGGYALHARPLTSTQWLWCMLTGVLSLIVGLFLRALGHIEFCDKGQTSESGAEEVIADESDGGRGYSEHVL